MLWGGGNTRPSKRWLTTRLTKYRRSSLQARGLKPRNTVGRGCSRECLLRTLRKMSSKASLRLGRTLLDCQANDKCPYEDSTQSDDDCQKVGHIFLKIGKWLSSRWNKCLNWCLYWCWFLRGHCKFWIRTRYACRLWKFHRVRHTNNSLLVG